MDVQHLNDLIELEERYWWHVAKRRLVVDLLARHFPPPGKLVEGGVGSARNLAEFQEMGYEVAGLDIMAEAVEHGLRRGVQDIRLHDLAAEWPFEDSSVRAVVLLDVLEHMADPVAVLQQAKRVLQSDGGIVFTVPAYGWLMSDWDTKLGHFRRYNKRMLREQARAAGFQVAQLSHWNSFTLPPAIVSRLLQRVMKRDTPAAFPRVSETVNSMLLGCASLERSVIACCGMPAGLSLVGVLRP